jgi:TolA-binding protein
MKTSLKLTAALAVLGSAIGTALYLSRSHPLPDAVVVPSEIAAAEKARAVDLARMKEAGIQPPATKQNGKTLSFSEKEATAKAKPTLHTSLLDLDLTRIPTEQELIEAGQLGDPLSPTSPADPAKITDPAKKALQERDNLAFGKAIQTWNEHHYDAAVKMFAQHVEDFPESPWAGESRLHIGCAAQYRGEYDVCYEQFGKILDTTKAGTDLNQKAQLRVANILTKQGRFEEGRADLSGRDEDGDGCKAHGLRLLLAAGAFALQEPADSDARLRAEEPARGLFDPRGVTRPPPRWLPCPPCGRTASPPRRCSPSRGNSA